MARKYVYENDEHEEKSQSGLSNKLAFLLVGGGIGAAVALLLAPKSGRELRGDITDATRKGLDKSRESATQLREHSGVYYEQLKGRATTAYATAADRLRNRSAQNQNANQLAESGLSVENSRNEFSSGEDETQVRTTAAQEIL